MRTRDIPDDVMMFLKQQFVLLGSHGVLEGSKKYEGLDSADSCTCMFPP
jgi:hypothetical protein